MNNQDILLTIDGMGIVIYSNEALKNYEEFKMELNLWADKRLPNGRLDLSPGLIV